MPEIETIGNPCKPGEESIVHKYSNKSRIYEREYRDRPESWHEWESIWTHRIRVCEIWSSSDEPEIREYSNYRCYEDTIPNKTFWHITISGDESTYNNTHDGVECEYERTIMRKPDTHDPFSWCPWEQYPDLVKS